MDGSTPSLPIIDMSNPDRQETARKLTKTMETEGFVYLDNVPGFNKQVETELLEAAQRFFSLPLEEKLRYSTKKWNKDAKVRLLRVARSMYCIHVIVCQVSKKGGF